MFDGDDSGPDNVVSRLRATEIRGMNEDRRREQREWEREHQ